MQTASSTGAESSQSALSAVRAPRFWRTPALILACGCLIALISFGARSGLGFFLTPMSNAHGWGRDVFALALAIQMLLWGAAQPVAGALADRYGATPVLSVERCSTPWASARWRTRPPPVCSISPLAR
jgi:MFS family permease